MCVDLRFPTFIPLSYPGYKSSFEYKNKQFASIRVQRTSLVPLFKLGDELTQVKRDMDDTLDGCGAGVADRDDPESANADCQVRARAS